MSRKKKMNISLQSTEKKKKENKITVTGYKTIGRKSSEKKYIIFCTTTAYSFLKNLLQQQMDKTCMQKKKKKKKKKMRSIRGEQLKSKSILKEISHSRSTVTLTEASPISTLGRSQARHDCTLRNISYSIESMIT